MQYSLDNSSVDNNLSSHSSYVQIKCLRINLVAFLTLPTPQKSSSQLISPSLSQALGSSAPSSSHLFATKPEKWCCTSWASKSNAKMEEPCSSRQIVSCHVPDAESVKSKREMLSDEIFNWCSVASIWLPNLGRKQEIINLSDQAQGLTQQTISREVSGSSPVTVSVAQRRKHPFSTSHRSANVASEFRNLTSYVILGILSTLLIADANIFGLNFWDKTKSPLVTADLFSHRICTFTNFLFSILRWD